MNRTIGWVTKVQEGFVFGVYTTTGIYEDGTFATEAEAQQELDTFCTKFSTIVMAN